jgi:hypothetical protein
MSLMKGGIMPNKAFMGATEVAEEIGVSTAYAYKLIRQLNADLQSRGFITINGRVSKQYFREKLYGEAFGNDKGGQDVSV